MREVLGFKQLQERIPEQELVLAVVLPPLQFVQVGVRMLDRDMVIRADVPAMLPAN